MHLPRETTGYLLLNMLVALQKMLQTFCSLEAVSKPPVLHPPQTLPEHKGHTAHTQQENPA
jgi:hypothetical protein